jgi:protoporphyrinogen oxidase
VIVDAASVFPDNWIYVHEPKVRVARIQNFKNWSPHMVPDPATSSLGLEYFCNQGDDIWNASDDELIALASEELVSTKIISHKSMVKDGCVFRIANAYPMYDKEYALAVDEIRKYLEGFTNLLSVGRNGLHRYNNQDHSMLAGRMAVEMLLLGKKNDLWSVNTEERYLETNDQS